MKNTIIKIAIIVFVLVFSANLALAQYTYTPMEKIPGFEGDPTDFPHYILTITKFALWTISIAALLMIVIGGFWYMTSAGNTSRAETAKKIILDAVLGVLVALATWLLLFVINPDLVNVNIKLTPVSIPSGTPGKKPTPPPATPYDGELSCTASQNLTETSTMLNCINSKADATSTTKGEIRTFEGSHKCNMSASPPKISCHYGGTGCNGYSNAIDYGGPGGSVGQGGGATHYSNLVNYARQCGSYDARCENASGQTRACSASDTNHIHVTVTGKCGCN